MPKALFLDRDGVINSMIWNSRENNWDSPYTMSEFQFLRGVPEAIRDAKAKGYLTIVVSNQPGIAKKKCAPAFLEQINETFLVPLVDDIYYCLHHPQSLVEELRQQCKCRKPQPGLLLRAAEKHNINLRESVLVGDRESDVEAGLSAGCRTIRVGEGSCAGTRAHFQAPDLPSAVLLI